MATHKAKYTQANNFKEEILVISASYQLYQRCIKIKTLKVEFSHRDVSLFREILSMSNFTRFTFHSLQNQIESSIGTVKKDPQQNASRIAVTKRVRLRGASQCRKTPWVIA